MKRSNDYAQGNDAFKKPRVAQGYTNHQGQGDYGGHGAHGGNHSGNPGGDMYGNAYGANPMLMGAYSQMAAVSQYGNQYGGDHLAMSPAYQPYQSPAFGAPYGSPFQVPFPPAVGPTGTPAGRTVYIGSVPSDASVEDVLNLVRSGLVENARLLPEKNCAFVSFIDGNAAAAFHHEGSTRKFNINGQDLKFGWGKASAVPSNIMSAVQQGATRNVFLGGIDESVTEQSLRADLSQFGPIDTIKILREKSIAFVHFASINAAMKAVSSLPQDPKYAGRRVNYGKDRSAKNSMTAPSGMPNAFSFGAAPGFSPFGGAMPAFNPNFDRFPQGGRQGSGNNSRDIIPMSILTAQGNRTVYLGNINQDSTCEEICNVIRGGILSSIRYLPAKHIAFVTFVDPQAATSFYNMASQQGVMIKNRRLKVGWGQNVHALPPPVIQALSEGATRNVYVGGLNSGVTESKLREDFSEFGEIELVNILKEKNCGFVNFTNITSAVKALGSIRRKPEYEMVKVNYGKDRCGNAPKVSYNNNNGGGNGNHNGGGNGNHNNNGNTDSLGGGSIDQSNGSDDGHKKSEDSERDIKDFEEDDEMFQVGV